MRLTRFGLHGGLFTGAMFVAFYGSPYSNLFFLLLGFLTLTGAVGLLAAFRNLRGVAAATTPTLPPIPSGTSARIPLDVHAPRRMRFDIRARLALDRGGALAGRVACVAERAQLTLESAPLPRGRYQVTRAKLESAHPFGIVCLSRAFQGPRELLVYPSPQDRLAGLSLREAQHELSGRDATQDGDLQPSGLRDHAAHEGTRAIHWRASARRGRLVVQEWEGGSGAGLEVLVDRRCDPVALEDALSALSALVSLARDAKETLRVHSQGLSATFGPGHRPWHELLEFLACAEVLPPSGPSPPLTSPTVTRLPRAAVVRHGE